MKTAVKIVSILFASALLLPENLPAQPGAPLPSEEALQAMPQLPSEEAYDEIQKGYAGLDLRAAERPIDEVPIGGLDAPVPAATIPVMIAFAIAAVAVMRRSRKERV